MTNIMEQNRLISHTISPEVIEKTVEAITQRIKSQGDKPYISVARQLDLLQQLAEFDFGCHLLQNKGVNGYWTHYMLTHPWFGRKTGKNNRGESLTELEDFLLNRASLILATQQRFEIFLKENQKQVKNHAKLACVPCGMMGELLYLNYKNITDITLVGIDYDATVLEHAHVLAEKQGLENFITLLQRDAWNLNFHNEFDLISSNGLNIYEPSQDKVTELYRQFYQALKPNGKLVTSFVTAPPTLTNQCEWDMAKVDQQDALLQKIIMVDILDAKFQCYSSSAQTREQLTTAGFTNLEFIYDEARMFPTVVAYKK